MEYDTEDKSHGSRAKFMTQRRAQIKTLLTMRLHIAQQMACSFTVTDMVFIFVASLNHHGACLIRLHDSWEWEVSFWRERSKPVFYRQR